MGVTLVFFFGGSSSSVSEGTAESESEVGSSLSSSNEESSSSLEGSKYLLFLLERAREGLVGVRCAFLGVPLADFGVERVGRPILENSPMDKNRDVDVDRLKVERVPHLSHYNHVNWIHLIWSKPMNRLNEVLRRTLNGCLFRPRVYILA